MTVQVSRSPRAPSTDLEDAVSKVIRLYEKEDRHAVPTEVAAKDLGYSGANNGAALRTLGALNAFGLIARGKGGMVSVAKEVVDYKHSPDMQTKRDILGKWLLTPSIYSELIQKFRDSLPSDAALKYDLIQRGFTPSAAGECVENFKKSVGFAEYYSAGKSSAKSQVPNDESSGETDAVDTEPTGQQTVKGSTQRVAVPSIDGQQADRIPIRLSGGRRAWLEIPSPFYEADKDLLRKHIDLILADEPMNKE